MAGHVKLFALKPMFSFKKSAQVALVTINVIPSGLVIILPLQSP